MVVANSHISEDGQAAEFVRNVYILQYIEAEVKTKKRRPLGGAWREVGLTDQLRFFRS